MLIKMTIVRQGLSTGTAGAWSSSSNSLSDVLSPLQAGTCVSPTTTDGDILGREAS